MKNLGFILIIFVSGNLFSQNAIISTSKTNAFYQWVENPLEIMVENHSCNEVVVKADRGKLKGSNCEYAYITDSIYFPYVKISIGINTKKGIEWVKSFNIHVRPLPDPRPMFGSLDIIDTILKPALLANISHIWLPMNDSWELYDNCFKQDLISFTIRILRKDSTLFVDRYFNPKGLCDVKNFQIYDSTEGDYILDTQFTRETYSYIVNECQKGDRVVIENIVALLYRKEKRTLENMSFILW